MKKRFKLFRLTTSPAVIHMKERPYGPDQVVHPFVLLEQEFNWAGYDSIEEAETDLIKHKDELKGMQITILPVYDFPYGE